MWVFLSVRPDEESVMEWESIVVWDKDSVTAPTFGSEEDVFDTLSMVEGVAVAVRSCGGGYFLKKLRRR